MTARIYVAVLITLILTKHCAVAQEKKRFREFKRTVQLSLFPGISTNGIGSAFYYNKFSLNIFGGLNGGNQIFELGLLTNNHVRSSTGIQLAGLANILGTNSFYNLTIFEERELLNDDFEVNNKGIQLAGFLNYVLNNSKGVQVTGGLNVDGGNFNGFQLAGIGNAAGGSAQGVMLAGIYNATIESVGGFQVSAVFNSAGETLSGLQLALINKAGSLHGKKSTPPADDRGFQIGILNFSKAMDGVQIGLINFGGAMRGKQIGLINFFNRNPSKEYTRMGTPIGLLNFGSKGSAFRFSVNELFPFNVEATTGNCLNCTWIMASEMPYNDANKIFNQNALMYSVNPFNRTWAFGYGFEKILYNKWSTRPHPNNERRVITYGVRFLHLNKSTSFDKDFNIVNKLHVSYGKRKFGMYLFAGVSINYFVFDSSGNVADYNIQSLSFDTGNVLSMASAIWPGYNFGVQF
jgi:hypothetical protein